MNMSHITDSPHLQIQDPVSYGKMTHPLQVNALDFNKGPLLPSVPARPTRAPAPYPPPRPLAGRAS